MRSELRHARRGGGGARTSGKARLAAMVERKLHEIVAASIPNEKKQRSWFGGVALESLKNIIIKRRTELEIRRSEALKLVSRTDLELVSLEKQEAEIVVFAAQEEHDSKSDVEYHVRKSKRQKFDVLIPMSRRGAAARSHQAGGGGGEKRRTNDVSFGSTVHGGGEKGEKGEKETKSEKMSEESEISTETKRQRARLTRTKLILARIVRILHLEETESMPMSLRSRRDARGGDAKNAKGTNGGARGGGESRKSEGDTQQDDDDASAHGSAALNMAELQFAVERMHSEMETMRAKHATKITECNDVMKVMRTKESALKTLVRDLFSKVKKISTRHCEIKEEISNDMVAQRAWCDKEMLWMKYQYDALLSNVMMEKSDECKAAKDRAAEQERSTRRAFAAAFEARIAELESEMVDREDDIVHLNVQLEQHQRKMKSAEELLMRLR